MNEIEGAEVRAHAAVDSNEPDARYVLITQCLQNDLLLNRECRLYIGDEGIRGFLVGRSAPLPDRHESHLKLGSLVRDGPLALFLHGTIGARLEGRGAGVLHVINIRDWHVADDSY